MRGAVTWESLGYLPGVAAVGVVCVVAIVVAYRAQLREAGWGWRWVVPGFRVMALVGVLVAVLRPTVLRPVGAGELGDVVVRAGEGRSMGVVDRSWRPEELVAVAGVLGELPSGVVRWDGEEVRKEVEGLRRLVDAAARAGSELEQARGAGRSVEEATRRASQARATLVNGWRAVVGRGMPEGVKGQWGDAATVLDAKGMAGWGDLRARIDAAVKGIEAEQGAADGRLYAADERVRVACGQLAGMSRGEMARRVVEKVVRPVVGVTDRVRAGRPVRGVLVIGDGREVVSVPGGAPVVACAVVPGVVRDVAITEVGVPGVAYVGEEARVRVGVRGAGFEGATVGVRVNEEKRDVVLGAEGRGGVDVPVGFGASGVGVVGIEVIAMDGEATGENNRVERRVRVLGRRPGATVVVGSGGRVELVRDVVGGVSGVAARVVGVGEAWKGERVVVLDDVRAGELSVEQLDGVREMVVERGGTMAMVAGRRNWPLDAESEAVWEEYLPYRLGEGGMVWRVASGRAGMGEVELPAVRRYVQLGALRPGVKVLATEPESGAALVTEMGLGRGKVVVVAADTVGGKEELARFWGGLLSRVVERPFAVERGEYAVDTGSADVEAGEAVRVRVRMPEGALGAVLVMRDGNVIRSESVRGAGEVLIGGLAAAEYVVRLEAGETGPAGMDVSVRVRGEEAGEVTPDLAALAKLAEGTGGEVVKVTEAQRLTEVLMRGDVPKVVEYPLWDSPYLFLFVTACLTTEWALRKRLGLA